jgi:hypothetical protein
MRTEDAAAYFGTVTRLAKLLGISRTAIYLWGEVVPPLRQYQIEFLSRGHLKADPELRRAAPAEWVDQAMSARASFYARRKMRAS